MQFLDCPRIFESEPDPNVKELFSCLLQRNLIRFFGYLFTVLLITLHVVVKQATTAEIDCIVAEVQKAITAESQVSETEPQEQHVASGSDTDHGEEELPIHNPESTESIDSAVSDLERKIRLKLCELEPMSITERR